MNDATFLRDLINFIKEREAAQQQEPEVAVISAEEEPGTEVEEIGAASDSGDELLPTDVPSPIDRDDVFVPPLQAKLEMMKKLTGVPPKDETLKQSQEQGGPAPVTKEDPDIPSPKQVKRVRIQDVIDDDPTGM